jgi:hypothetical protein
MNLSLFNRLVELGFEPGERNPEEWAVSRIEELVAADKVNNEKIRKLNVALDEGLDLVLRSYRQDYDPWIDKAIELLEPIGYNNE